MTELRIGVVGYSIQKFNAELAEKMISGLFNQVYRYFDEPADVTVVSGLTDLGIPGLAYREAKRRGWKTAGIACSKAAEHKCFQVDERMIVGSCWGDERETFLNSISVLVRIGGGNQSHEEVRVFRNKGGKVYERELAQILS